VPEHSVQRGRSGRGRASERLPTRRPLGRVVVPVTEWIEDEFMERCSHALAAEGGTWLIDPVDNPRIDELENVVGVVQLLDRHNRDCASVAGRLGVPHNVVPLEPLGPFEVIRVVQRRRWREVALWWLERRTLVCADVLGTARYYPPARQGPSLHPLLPLPPP